MNRLLLTLLLPLLIFSGCGLTDPTLETDVPESTPAPAPAKPAHLPGVLAAKAATRPARSPRAAASTYANLMLNWSINDRPAALEHAIALSTTSQAARTNAAYEAAVAARLDSGQFPQGQVLTTTAAPDGPADFVYVITRSGSYTQDGAPVGETSVVVYSVRTDRTRGGYLIRSWERTR